jgi:hypothetical protein
MSRESRLKEYARPLRPENWQGAGRDQANIDRWSERATKESQIAARALGPVHGGPLGTKDQDLPSLPSTGKRQESRPTAMGPREPRNINKRMRGEDDLNHVGESNYMAGIRRTV